MPTWVSNEYLKKILITKSWSNINRFDTFRLKTIKSFSKCGNTHGNLMKVIDKIHLRFGESLLKLGNQDLNQTWKMRQESLSCRYTTDVREIIKVK